MNDFSLITLLTGSIFFLAGVVLMMLPPSRINSLYGYRTPASMRNPETWKEANRYSARLMLITGIVLLILAAGFLSKPIVKAGIFLGLGCVILTATLLIISTELHLRRVFDRDGKRREKN